MNKNIIETFDLSKIYKLKQRKKEIIALNDINISIKEGEIFGLLGPNGAGKTTLIQILTTLRQPTTGYALIDGNNILKKPKKAKSKVALMLDDKMLYYRITAYDNLKFFCKIYNVPNYDSKIKEIVKEFGLSKWLNQYVENFSSGMKMKLAFCRTFLLERPILFLDEPTLGLDVNSILFVIEKLKNLNKTIFLTSHDMNVVEKVCNRIAFINNGNILKVGTPNDLKRFIQQELKIEIEIKVRKNELIKDLKKYDYIDDAIEINNGVMITLKERKYYKNLLAVLSKFEITNFKQHELSVEDLFIKIIQN